MGESMSISMAFIERKMWGGLKRLRIGRFSRKETKLEIGEAKVSALAKVFIRLKDRSASACIDQCNGQVPCMWGCAMWNRNTSIIVVAVYSYSDRTLFNSNQTL